MKLDLEKLVSVQGKANTYVAKIEDCFRSNFRRDDRGNLNLGGHLVTVNISVVDGPDFSASFPIDVHVY